MAYRAMAAAGRLPLRVVASVREEQLDRAMAIGFRSGRGVPDDERGRYRDGWLKLFSDGALGSRTAALLAPYEPDDPAGPPPAGATGLPLRSFEQLLEVADVPPRAASPARIHAIGDAAVRTVLDVIEQLQRARGDAPGRACAAGGPGGHRTLRSAGGGRLRPALPPAEADASAMRESWGARSGCAFPAGRSRAGGIAHALLHRRARRQLADPWPGIAAAVTRRGPGWDVHEAFHPEQSVSFERALRSTCLDGPRSARIDDQGHLGAGARADMLVLPTAILAEPSDSPTSSPALARWPRCSTAMSSSGWRTSTR